LNLLNPLFRLNRLPQSPDHWTKVRATLTFRVIAASGGIGETGPAKLARRSGAALPGT